MVVDVFLGLLYPGECRSNLDLDRRAAVDFLNATDTVVLNSSLLNVLTDPTGYDGRVRGMVGVLMCFPRFQEQ